MKKIKGFTLIEFLLVIAIISIIAAIVVPNIMSANIRAKVTAIERELGSIAIALEDHKTDRGFYPVEPQNDPGHSGLNADEIGSSGVALSGNSAAGLGKLIYPVTSSSNSVYLYTIPGDPFNNNGEEEWDGSSGAHNHHYCYFTGKDDGNGNRINSQSGDSKAYYWALVSYGPDKDQDITSYVEAWKAVDTNAPNYNPAKAYNPDNGITSSGDIIIIGP